VSAQGDRFLRGESHREQANDKRGARERISSIRHHDSWKLRLA
jgi:hypothetical protein